ncbi:MAG: cupin domain-containing protein [Burkholderiaceae bacterium]
MKVKKAGSEPSSLASADQFTGRVRRDALISAELPGRVRTGLVTFEAGARTAWHTHPAGQILIIVSGRGWRCRPRRGTPRGAPGDSVWIPAGQRHWHGATMTTAMTHIAVTESVQGDAVTWMTHVTDEQYDPT